MHFFNFTWDVISSGNYVKLALSDARENLRPLTSFRKFNIIEENMHFLNSTWDVISAGNYLKLALSDARENLRLLTSFRKFTIIALYVFRLFVTFQPTF